MPKDRKAEQQKLKQEFEKEYFDPKTEYIGPQIDDRVAMMQKYLQVKHYADITDEQNDSFTEILLSENTTLLLTAIAKNIQNWDAAVKLLEDGLFKKAAFGDLFPVDEQYKNVDRKTAFRLFRINSIPNMKKDPLETDYVGENTGYNKLYDTYRNIENIPEKIEFLIDYQVNFTAREENGEVIPQAERNLKSRMENDFFKLHVDVKDSADWEIVFKTLGKLRAKNTAETYAEHRELKTKLENTGDRNDLDEKAFWLALKSKSGRKREAINSFQLRAYRGMYNTDRSIPKESFAERVREWLYRGISDFMEFLGLKDSKVDEFERYYSKITEYKEPPKNILAWTEDKGQRLLGDANSEFSSKKFNEELASEFNSKHINHTYDNALKLFNSKRLGIFRQESNTHAKVRVAAENMIKFQNSHEYGDLEESLDAITDPGNKKEFAKKWLDTARTLNYEADHYYSVKNPYTFAGSDRHRGASELKFLAEEEYKKCEEAIEYSMGLDLNELYREIAAEKRESVINEFKNLDISKPTASKDGKSVDDQILEQKKNVYHIIFKAIASEYSGLELAAYPGNTKKGNFFSVLSKFEKNVFLAGAVVGYISDNWDKDTILHDLSENKLTNIMKDIKERGVNLEEIINPERVEARQKAKEQVKTQNRQMPVTRQSKL